MGLITGSRRSPGEGNGYPLQYFYPENFMDREAWQAIQSMGSQRVRQDREQHFNFSLHLTVLDWKTRRKSILNPVSIQQWVAFIHKLINWKISPSPSISSWEAFSVCFTFASCSFTMYTSLLNLWSSTVFFFKIETSQPKRKRDRLHVGTESPEGWALNSLFYYHCCTDSREKK